MALPPTPAGAPSGASALDTGPESPAEDAGESPDQEGLEENVVVVITSHDDPSGGTQYSVYDHMPNDGDASGGGDGAVVTTDKPGQALAAAFKLVKNHHDGGASSDMESGFNDDNAPSAPSAPMPMGKGGPA